MGWVIRDATWGGIPLEQTSVSDNWSRRIVQHQYPGRDGAELEDLGRAPVEITVAGNIISDAELLQRIRAAFEAGVAAELVHPLHGAINVRCTRLSIRASTLNAAEIEITFVEDQLNSAAFATVSSASATAAQAVALVDTAAALAGGL